MIRIKHASQNDVELMNANLGYIAARLTEAGVPFQSVEGGAHNYDACIWISEGVSISVGVDGASVTTQDGDSFEFGESRAIEDTASLIADIRSAQ